MVGRRLAGASSPYRCGASRKLRHDVLARPGKSLMGLVNYSLGRLVNHCLVQRLQIERRGRAVHCVVLNLYLRSTWSPARVVSTVLMQKLKRDLGGTQL